MLLFSMLCLGIYHFSHTITISLQKRIVGSGTCLANTKSGELVIQRLIEVVQGLLCNLQLGVSSRSGSRQIEHINQPIFKEQRAFIIAQNKMSWIVVRNTLQVRRNSNWFQFLDIYIP